MSGKGPGGKEMGTRRKGKRVEIYSFLSQYLYMDNGEKDWDRQGWKGLGLKGGCLIMERLWIALGIKGLKHT